ncbi:hypothetical protein DL770_010978 [Monosporascus sp. CRB-9-2]|nr:hypothetical protein DL770_010978 [Monosporascus sp. CRB-9-2]
MQGKKQDAPSSPGQYYILTRRAGNTAAPPFAVGELEKNLQPQIWRQLDQVYARYGYYQVNKLAGEDDVMMNGDVEFYANPRDRHAVPIHAHRILDAAAGVYTSKIGGPSSSRTAARFSSVPGGHRPVTTGALRRGSAAETGKGWSK